ncbi:MAG: PqqD family protein [Thermodesulfovibrionales bacterium]|nr:PqqD family protein [Thermodesulfovibrionales bacterium]
MVDKDSYISRSDKAAYKVIDNEAMVVTPGSNKQYVFNLVGFKIWEMANGEIDIRKIARAICEEFNVTYEQAVKDAIEFAEELSVKGLLEVKS